YDKNALSIDPPIDGTVRNEERKTPREICWVARTSRPAYEAGASSVLAIANFPCGFLTRCANEPNEKPVSARRRNQHARRRALPGHCRGARRGERVISIRRLTSRPRAGPLHLRAGHVLADRDRESRACARA